MHTQPVSHSLRPRLPSGRQGSILRRALWQSVLLGVFIVTFLSLMSFVMLGGVADDLILGIQGSVPEEAWGAVFRVLDNHGLLDGSLFRSTMLAIAGLMILCAGAIGFLLARSLTEPIRTLTAKVRRLSPGTWLFRSSIHTGDEVEILDRTIADLTTRLKGVYDHLEEEVADRTKQLKEQYALDRAILQSVGQGVLCTDRDGRIVTVNPAALEMVDAEEKDMLGKRASAVLLLHAHHARPAGEEHLIDRCLRTRAEVRSAPDSHMSVQRKDGTSLPVLILVTPLFVGSALQGTVTVLQDMSEERQVDYLKSEFIALASHQLRTPLSSLRWYSELLQEGNSALSEDQKTYISEITAATSRMLNLLNALLHAAKLEDREMEPRKTDVDLRDIVSAAAEDARMSASQHGLACEKRLPVAPVRAFTDSTLLGVILQNLLSNAMKYTPKGKTVTIELLPKGGHAEIVVRDQGIGIPGREVRRVFQKFFRATNVRQIDTDGSGLGLYISKSIVDRLGGTIAFHSEEGKGTTFTVSLPLGKTTK